MSATIKEYNSRTGSQVRGMHCFGCGEDEVIPSYKQHGNKMYVDFICSNCKDHIELPVSTPKPATHNIPLTGKILEALLPPK